MLFAVYNRRQHEWFLPFLGLILLICLSTVDGKKHHALSEKDKQNIVSAMNQQRRSVIPTATNLRELKWCKKLGRLAQKAADTCRFEHNYGGHFKGLGESLYLGMSGARDATMMFFLERENFRYKDIKCKTKGDRKYKMYDTCGHYYQTVSPRIKAVGCGRARCQFKKYGGAWLLLMVCEFDKGHEWKKPYPRGKFCSNCPADSPWCYKGLCVSSNRRTQVGRKNTVCALRCLNCGKLDKQRCTCSCSADATGNICQHLKPNKSLDILKCSPCAARGHSCPLDRGMEDYSRGSTCNCQCYPGYSGKACEVKGYAPKLNYLGCYESPFILSSAKVAITAVDGINRCARHCAAKGFKLLALRRGKYCSCGNGLPPDSVKKSEDLCRKPCPNDVKKSSISYCGGKGNIISVYHTLHAVQLSLHGRKIMKSEYPIPPWNFHFKVWPAVQKIVAAAVNEHCDDRKIACCGDKKAVNVATASQVRMVEPERMIKNGFTTINLEVICQTKNRNEERLSAALLKQALTAQFANLKVALHRCCGTHVEKKFNIIRP